MKFEDLKTKSKDELAKSLLDFKKQQMELRFKGTAGQLEKTHEVRALRRNIARVHTAMNAPVSVAKVKAEKATPAKAKAPAKTTKTTKAKKTA